MDALRKYLKAPEVQVMRVNQVDAARLDVEMTGMLREQLVKVFALVQPGLLAEYEPELNAILEFLVWRFSIWLDRPTPGNGLMNLRYRDERAFKALSRARLVRTGLEGPGLTTRQKLLMCLLTIGGRYAWARLSTLSAFRRWGDRERGSLSWRAWGLLQRVESAVRISSFVNLLIFLRTGRYQSLVERLLGARLVYERATMSRAVSFEYMNRQLVWTEFSELLLLVLPLLNLDSFKRTFLSPFAGGGGSSAAGVYADDTCPVCGAHPIVVPYVASPCGHLYCYYCVRTRTLADASFKCLACSAKVVAIGRHRPRKGVGAAVEKP